jgi:SAM-dependent methyltransferase
MMNPQATGEDLLKYFEHADHRLIHKWLPYFEIYERHLSHFRGQAVRILEIGVYHGGSLQMWKHFLGPKAKVYGIDIDPRCKTLEEDGIEIFTLDSGDRMALKEFCAVMPKFDIVIDDGGHTMEQQTIALQELFWHVKNNGVYICEDTHTSYKKDRTPGIHGYPFMEYTKLIIDRINAHHSDYEELQPDDYTRFVHGLHYYDSMVVIEKREHQAPQHRMFGTPSFEPNKDERFILEGSSKLPKITQP